MGMRNRVLAGLAGAVAAVAIFATASAAPSGSLRPVEEQLSATLSGGGGVDVAPDGRNVYGVGIASDEIGVFDRNSNTGAIEFADATEGDGLLAPTSVDVSPNGDNVFVTGEDSDSVHAYERSASDGSLNNIDSVIDGDSGADGLNAAHDLVVSPDGDHVYATGSDDDAVSLMGVDGDGELQWLDAFINLSEGISNMNGPRGIAISPDGKNVYVAGTLNGAVVTFTRFAGSGQLDFLESDAGFFEQSEDIAVSADGTRVYVGFDDGIRTFRRNKATGALTLLGLTTPPTSVFGVAASPDGANVYASNAVIDAGISSLATTRNAKLRFVENDEIQEFISPSSVAVSGDARHVYLGGGTTGDGHIAVFSRQPALELKGKKSQKASKLKVKAECSADCKVTLKGKGLKKATKQLKAGKPKTLKLKGADGGGKVTVKGKAKAGNRSDADRLKIKLK
jgi:6-phosphogluconolactonase (cycloisomerase 2 family)